MLSIFKRFSKLGRFNQTSLLKKQKLQQIQKTYFSENFEDELNTYKRGRSNTSSNRPRTFSRVEGRQQQDRNVSNFKNTFYRSTLEDIINHMNSNEIQENEYYDFASLLANKLEYESPFNIRNLGIDRSPQVVKVINHFAKNLNNMNSDQYLTFISLLYTFEIKNLNIPTKNFYGEFIEKGRKVLEDIKENPEFFKTINLVSYLGYFTFVDTRNLIHNSNAQLSIIGTSFLTKVIRRFSTWPNSNLKNNQMIKPILEYFVSIRETESIISKLKLFKSVCILDGKFTSEATGNFIKEIGEDIRNTEEFINGPYFSSVLDHLLLAKSNQKNVIISKIHKTILETPYSNKNMVFYLSFLGKLGEDLSNYGEIEILLNNALSLLNSETRADDIISILNLLKIKRIDETDYIHKTFDLIKDKVNNLTYNNSVRTYKNSLLKCLSSRFQEISETISEKISQEVQNSKAFGRDFNNLLILSNFCDESVADNLLNLIVNRIQDGLNSYRFSPNVLNDWVEKRQEFVKFKYRAAIGRALLLKINQEGLTTMNDKNMFKLFLNLNDLLFDRKDEVLRNKYYEIQNYIKAQPKFRENLSRNLLSSIFSETNISNASFVKCTSMLKDVYSNMEVTNRQIDQLIQIVFNVVSNLPQIENENIQTMLNFIDSISSKVTVQDEVTLYKLNSNFRLFSSRKLQSKYIESNLYNKLIKLENENFSQDVYPITSGLLESTIPIENKKNLIKMIFKRLINDEGRINFYDINELSRIHFIRIVASSNKILPELVTREVALASIDFLKQTISSMDKYNQYTYLSNLVLFNPKLIDSNIREYLSASLRDLNNDINIKYAINKIEDFPVNNRYFFTVQNIFINYLSQKYEQSEYFDKRSFFRVLDIITKHKFLYRRIYNKFIEQYGSYYDSFNYEDNLKMINLFSRVSLTKHDLIESALKKINLSGLEDREKLNLYNSLCKLDFLQTESQIGVMKSLLTDIEGFILKGEYYLNNTFLINLYNSKTFHSEFYEKTIDFLVNKFNSQAEKFSQKIRQFSNDEIFVLGRLSIAEKYNPQIISTINSRIEFIRSISVISHFYKLTSEVLNQMKHTEVQAMPNNLPCHFYLPKQNICIFLLSSKETNFHEDTPNYLMKIAINECSAKGNKIVTLTTQNLKEMSKNNTAMDIIKSFEDSGIPNLTTDNSYNLTELSKFFGSSSTDKAEVESEEPATEEPEKIKI